MAKGIYVGVGGVTKKVKSIYVGVGGVPKKVKKAYIGVGGVPKLIWQSGIYTDALTMVDISNTSVSNAMLLYPEVIRTIPLDNNRFVELIISYPNGYTYITQGYLRVVTYINGTITYGPLFDLGYYHYGVTADIDPRNFAYMLRFGCTDLMLRPDGNIALVAGSLGTYQGQNRDNIIYKEFSISGSALTLVAESYFSVTNIYGYSAVGFNPATNQIYAVSAEISYNGVGPCYVYIFTAKSGRQSPDASVYMFQSRYGTTYHFSKFSFNKARTRLIFARRDASDNINSYDNISLYSLSGTVLLMSQVNVSIPTTSDSLVNQYSDWSNEYMLLSTTNGYGRVISYKNDVLSYSSIDTALGNFGIGRYIRKLKDEDILFNARVSDSNFIGVDGVSIQVRNAKVPPLPNYYTQWTNGGIQILEELLWIYTQSTSSSGIVVFYSKRGYFT